MSDPVLEVAELMEEVRARARRRGTGGGDIDAEVEGAVSQIFREARDRHREGHARAGDLLMEDPEWPLETVLRVKSHRPVFGGLLVFVKRRLLRPFVQWVVQYGQDNFRRQQELNEVLLAAVEVLAERNARLELEMRRIAEGDVEDP